MASKTSRQTEDADGTLRVGPYYNKPTQEGFYQYFKAVAEEVDLPIVLYNIPGRCGAGMTPETVGRLAELENIVAIKEATGSLDQTSEIATRCGITIISGDDSLTLVPTVNSIRAQKSKTGIAFWAGTPPKQIRPSWFLEKASN